MYSVATSNGMPIDIFSTLFNPSQYAKQQFQKVLNSSDYQGILYFYASYQVQNAMAVSRAVYNNQYPYQFIHYDRYVIYNPNFMKHMEFTSGNEFVTLSIFAHELGHHFYAHTDNPNQILKHPWDKEAEADYYSGFVLAKLQATPKDLEQSQRLLFTTWSSMTHPDSYKRISSIIKGWKDGGGIGIAEDNLQNIYNKINNELNRWDVT